MQTQPTKPSDKPHAVGSQAPSQNATNEGSNKGKSMDGSKYVNANPPGSLSVNPKVSLKDGSVDSNSPYASSN